MATEGMQDPTKVPLTKPQQEKPSELDRMLARIREIKHALKHAEILYAEAGLPDAEIRLCATGTGSSGVSVYSTTHLNGYILAGLEDLINALKIESQYITSKLEAIETLLAD